MPDRDPDDIIDSIEEIIEDAKAEREEEGDDDDDSSREKMNFLYGNDPMSTTFTGSFNVGPKHTPEEKAYFHAIKAARRLAELEYHRESAEVARVISEWYETVDDDP